MDMIFNVLLALSYIHLNRSLFISYPSINQFRRVVQEVQTKFIDVRAPIINFRGTVKLHGANGGIGIKNNEMWVQSRNREITVNDDCFGFAKFVSSHSKTLKDFLMSFKCKESVCIFGEWCGSDIMTNVAINNLPKMFAIFDVLVDNTWLSPAEYAHLTSPTEGIYNIHQFPTYDISIDFNQPESNESLLASLTDAVEMQCPVGKQLGVEGIGEGIVWTGHCSAFPYPLKFKIKGKEHSISKVKNIASPKPDKIESIESFATYAVTENRLNQAIEQLFTSTNTLPTEKDASRFLKWVSDDILKEEGDTLSANKLTMKDVAPVIVIKAQIWFLTKIVTHE